MKLTTKRILATFATLAIFAVPMVAFGQWDPTAGSEGTNLNTTSDFADILNSTLKWALAILAIIAVIAFVISGIYYITSGGTDRQETAKMWLIGSITGLIVALLGYVIVVTIDNIING